MNKYVEHIISESSPLNLLEDRGYRLLEAVAKTEVPASAKVLLPDYCDYITKPKYSTCHVANSQPLAYVKSPERDLLRNEVWSLVTGFSLALQNSSLIKSSLNIYSTNREWSEYTSNIVDIAIGDLNKLRTDPDLCAFDALFDLIARIFEESSNGDFSELKTMSNALCHCDLHSSNIIVSEAGIYIIDFDNLCAAPAYSDLLLFSLIGLDAIEGLACSLNIMRDSISREVSLRADLAYSFAVVVILCNWSHVDHKIRLLHTANSVLKYLIEHGFIIDI